MKFERLEGKLALSAYECLGGNLLPGAAEATGAAGRGGQFFFELILNGRSVQGHQLEQAVAPVDGEWFTFNMVAGGHYLTPVTAVDQTDGVGHAQGCF